MLKSAIRCKHTFLAGDHPRRISLNHKDEDGRASPIWPSLFCDTLVVKDDTALFGGDKAFLHAGAASIHPRLFAVQYPGLPVDITKDILWRWAVANGRDLNKTFSRYSLAMPEENHGGVVVHLEFWSGSYMSDEDWPETGELQLDWSEVLKIMHSVQVKGMLEKDLRWHTPYIETD